MSRRNVVRALAAGTGTLLLAAALWASRPTYDGYYLVDISSPNAKHFQFEYELTYRSGGTKRASAAGPAQLTVRAPEFVATVRPLAPDTQVRADVLRCRSRVHAVGCVSTASATTGGSTIISIFVSKHGVDVGVVHANVH